MSVPVPQDDSSAHSVEETLATKKDSRPTKQGRRRYKNSILFRQKKARGRAA